MYSKMLRRQKGLSFPNYDTFIKSCQPQTFPFPKTIIDYIFMNPATPKGYQKSIHCCKIFFIKNPILVINYLECDSNNQWTAKIFHSSEIPVVSKRRGKIARFFQTSIHEKYLLPTIIDFDGIESKIWLIDKFQNDRKKPVINNIVSLLIPKLHRCDIKSLILYNQKLSFKEFQFITLNVEDLHFENTFVTHESGTEVCLDEITDNLPLVKTFRYSFGKNQTAKFNTVENFYGFCSKRRNFFLLNISQEFDIEEFYKYLKKNNSKTFVFLAFPSIIPEEYKARIVVIIDEILNAEAFDFLPPVIWCHGMMVQYSEISEIVNKQKAKFLQC